MDIHVENISSFNVFPKYATKNNVWTDLHIGLVQKSKKAITLTHLPMENMEAILQTIFLDIFMNEKYCIFIKTSLKLFLKVQLTID